MGMVRHIFALSLLLYLVLSCKKESFYTGSDAFLRFSADTVSFDTVFTTIGSATRRLTVYNPYDQSLKINSIAIADAKNTNFVLNINGLNASSSLDIDLDPHDSLLILVQFYHNPLGSNNPMLIKDSILFEVNQHQQNVKLEAFGQDVHILKSQSIGTQEWQADKPYLIYGDVILDTLSTLTIDKGAKLYFHRNANLRIKGSLIAIGDILHPIVFRSDRLEREYNDVPGQWGGLQFLPGSNHNLLDWLIIENGVSGIQLGGYHTMVPVDLSISNTIIQKMTYDCLLAYNAKITASNCIFAHAYNYTCGLLDGGDYTFYHCTLKNMTGNMPALYFTSYDAAFLPNMGTVKTEFYNSIIYGYADNEIKFDFQGTTTGSIQFENCLLKCNDDSTDLNHYKNIIWNKDPDFKNSDSLDFQLKPLSPAINKGSLIYGELFPLDLKMNNRILDNQPDIGAYEYRAK